MDLRAFYETLLDADLLEGLREGNWQLCGRTGWPDNDSFRNLVAWSWHSAREHRLIVVNLSSAAAQGMVRLSWEDLPGRRWQVTDLFTGQGYEHDGNEMYYQGLYVDLSPWGFHILTARAVERVIVATGRTQGQTRASR